MSESQREWVQEQSLFSDPEEMRVLYAALDSFRSVLVICNNAHSSLYAMFYGFCNSLSVLLVSNVFS